MRSIELPANAIVIFIIAITVLLAVIYFFFSAYQNTSPSLISTANQTSSQLEQTQTKMKCMMLTYSEIINKCTNACEKRHLKYTGKYDITNKGLVCYCKSRDGGSTRITVECDEKTKNSEK